jgi:hypothetical protein
MTVFLQALSIWWAPVLETLVSNLDLVALEAFKNPGKTNDFEPAVGF